MPGSLNRIRDSMSVEPTKRDKGLTLTVRVTAYDNGMVEVDGIPINQAPDYDAGHGWMGASEITVATLAEFRRQVEKRRKTLSPRETVNQRDNTADADGDPPKTVEQPPPAL